MILYNKEIFHNVFVYPARYWYKNIKRIPLYFRRLHFLIKNGYDEYAQWETFNWFIRVMKPILKKYKENQESIPALTLPGDESFTCDDAFWEERVKIWNNVLDTMIKDLDLMEENNPIYDNYPFDPRIHKDNDIKINKAKDDFFRLFSEYFYYLWD